MNVYRVIYVLHSYVEEGISFKRYNADGELIIFAKTFDNAHTIVNDFLSSISNDFTITSLGMENKP